MKKLLSTFLVMAMVLTGCSSTGGTTTTPAPAGTPEPQNTASVITDDGTYERTEGSSIVVHKASGREIDLDNLKVACVHKCAGFFWMDSTNDEGVNWAADNGGATWSYFPAAEFDAASQMSALMDAMASDPDILIVCPTAGDAVNEAIATAKAKGTLVIAVEGDYAMTNVDYFLDPFDPEPFVQMHVDELVERHGDDFTYCLFVGKLTTPFQVLWCDYFYDYATEKYPNLTSMTERGAYIEHDDDDDTAAEMAKQVIMGHPEVSILWSSSAGGTEGLCRAIDELGVCESVQGCGHACPVGSEYALNNGSMIFSTIHYPGAWGWTAAELGRMVIAGEAIEDGASLGFEGYEEITVLGKQVFGEGWYLQDAENVHETVERWPLL